MLADPDAIEAFFNSIDKMMFSLCPTLRIDQNPLTSDLNRTSTEMLSRVMCQYSFFSRDIVSLLRNAQLAFKNWPLVSQELDRNISEEMGGGMPGASHYELLGLGVADEFGLDVTQMVIEPSTALFLDQCLNCMQHCEPQITAGAVYALEATASHEIAVLKAIACELSRRMRGRIVPPHSVLGHFLDGHICNFEPEHKARLRDAIVSHCDVSKDHYFREGFSMILSAMYAWWMSLSMIETGILAHA